MSGTAETLGESIPALPHAVSVSLPTWRDNVGYEEGEKRVVDAMVTGYPRFFIHQSIQKLSDLCEARFGQNGERSMLFPSARIAEECRAFMINHEAQLQQANHLVRVIQFAIQTNADTASSADCTPSDLNCLAVHITLFPPDFYKLARQFWQHTGLGISSRFAERCLVMLNELGSGPASPTPSYKGKGKAKALPPKAIKGKKSNRHYARKGSLSAEQPSNGPAEEGAEGNEDGLTESHDTYLEERYGRNMSIADGEVAKRTLRRRIAGVLLRDPDDSLNSLPTDSAEQQVGSSSRGVQSLSENDVYLYPTGMGAIWSSHQLALKTMPPQAKGVCFGFPYTDTLKILQKWGPGCVHYGHGTPEDLAEFTAFLCASPPGTVSAFYTEFPSNPLLRSVDLKAVRKLADEHDFMVVVDDTIGNFANVEVLPCADIVVSGLTKLFSGDANVMGGSLVLNPERKYYQQLKEHLGTGYEDTYFSEDAIFLERNSRDFLRRVHQIDANTLLVATLLQTHSQRVSDAEHVVKKVWYPIYETRDCYEGCRVRSSSDGRRKEGGYGGLLSVTFLSQAASEAFFDALRCAKGPSLGTNFTLACPYTILAHYAELDWAQGWGVDKDLIRISVGLEDPDDLLKIFGDALNAAVEARNKSA